jgi:hypothetical protein
MAYFGIEKWACLGEGSLVNRNGSVWRGLLRLLSLLKNIDYGIFEIAEEACCLRAEVWKETSVD